MFVKELIWMSDREAASSVGLGGGILRYSHPVVDRNASGTPAGKELPGEHFAGPGAPP